MGGNSEHSTAKYSGILEFNDSNNNSFDYIVSFAKTVRWIVKVNGLLGFKRFITTALDVIGSEIYKLDRGWRRCFTYSVFCISLRKQTFTWEFIRENNIELIRQNKKENA